MKTGFGLLTMAAALFTGCSRERTTAADPDLAAEIGRIKAIDNHAHPVRIVPNGGPPDREFDALPVDNMEPESDPVNLRPGSPLVMDVAKALFGGGTKARTMQERGDQYPAWVLDQMGVDVMLANRVAMGSSIQPPRFRWVPYADALLFPLDNSVLAARNSDRKSFFALDDQLSAR